MSNKLYEENDIQNIANAIRNKNGTEDTYKVSQMSTAINSIEVIEQATAEGESLSLANTKAMPYSDYVVEGKSEQATSTQSANLFDEEYYNNDSLYSTNVYKYTKTKIKGNRSLYVQCALKSGKTAINGLYVALCSVSNPNTSGAIYRWFINNGNTNQIGRQDFTGIDELYFVFYPANTNVNDIFDNYNLWVSTDNINYEPFVPDSPSPDYPSDIHSVADDVNLFDVTSIPEWVGGSTSYSVNNNTLKVAGPWFVGYLLDVDKNTDYYFSNIKTIITSTAEAGKILVMDNSKNNVIKYIYNENEMTFNTGSYSQIYILFYCGDGNYGEVDFTNIKLQKGTVSTPYSPYNQGTVTIKQRGKNLIDYGTKNFTTFYQEYGLNIPAGIYTFSAKVTSSDTSQNRSRAYFYDSNGTSLGYVSLLRGGRSNETITLNGTAVRIVLYSSIDYSSSNGKEATYEDIQLEIGTQETSYEPYQTPHDYTIQTEPLRSLPNGVKDTIEADGIHRRVGRVVLDGSESGWYKQDNTSYSEDYLRFTIGITDKKNASNPNSKKDNILSNNFTNKILDNNPTRKTNSITGQFSTNLINIFVAQNIINGSRVDDFKTWLSTHNTEILYELEEEIIEPLTQNQATTMLDIIKTGSYEGTTNIYTDEDVKPTIGVDYYKKG